MLRNLAILASLALVACGPGTTDAPAAPATIAADDGNAVASVPLDESGRPMSDAEQRFRRNFEDSDRFVQVDARGTRVVLDRVTGCVYNEDRQGGLHPLLPRGGGNPSGDCSYR